MSAFFSTIPGSIILLLIGFVLLIKGADFFVEGSSSIAKMLKIPSLIIGMTIVAMGTSLPECAVSVSASLANSNQLAIGNVVGSNIFNLMVVLGSCALFSKLMVSKTTMKKDFPFSIICAILLLATGIIGYLLGRIDGIIFLVIFTIFLVDMVKTAMKARNNNSEEAAVDNEIEKQTDEIKEVPVFLSIIFIIGGALAVTFGGNWVVDSCSTLAMAFGMSETLVGLTIAAVGTSLPELVTSIVAARKNELDMAIGNVVGSNVFNILMVLGIAAAISPIDFAIVNIIDTSILIVFSIVVLIMCKVKGYLGKLQGAVMIFLYIAYLAYIVIRDGGLV